MMITQPLLFHQISVASALITRWNELHLLSGRSFIIWLMLSCYYGTITDVPNEFRRILASQLSESRWPAPPADDIVGIMIEIQRQLADQLAKWSFAIGTNDLTNTICCAIVVTNSKQELQPNSYSLPAALTLKTTGYHGKRSCWDTVATDGLSWCQLVLRSLMKKSWYWNG